MTPKEKKAFVARMKKGKKDAAKGKSKSKGGGKSNKYWDKIYHLTFKGEKIPYQITKGKKEIVLNFNKKDYPDQVNKILKRKYPTVNSVQHNTHYVFFESFQR